MKCNYCGVTIKGRKRKWCGRGCYSEVANRKKRTADRENFWRNLLNGKTESAQSYMGTWRREI